MKKLITLIAVAFVATLSGFAQAPTPKTVYEQTSFTQLAWQPEGTVVNASFDNGEAILTNNAKTANNWDYQYRLFEGVSLNTSTEYTVTIRGKAEGSGTATVHYKVGDWGSGVEGDFEMTAGDDYKDYTFKVTPTVAEGNALMLQHGHFVGTIRWKAVKITYIDPTGAQKVLVITSTADKTQAYESQVFINLPTLTSGKTHYVKFLAKSTVGFNFGSEGIDDNQTDHKDPYNNSAVFNYTAAGDVTSNYQEFTIALPGVTDVECTTHEQKHTGFEYAPTALLLNIGRLPQDAVFTIANVRVYNEEFAKVADVEFTSVGADDKTKTVYYLDWQHSRTVDIEYQFAPVVVEGINEAKTYSSAYNIDFTGVTDVEAYIATEVANNKVTMTQINGSVPAGTGIVLKQVGEKTSVILNTCETASANVSANILVATNEETTVTEDAYVLAGTGNDLGWYKVGATKPTLAAGKAYLRQSGGNAKIGISWGDDNTTGVEAISTKANEADDAWYTVTGVKVNGVKKGLYIHNGKKVIVRQ